MIGYTLIYPFATLPRFSTRDGATREHTTSTGSYSQQSSMRCEIVDVKVALGSEAMARICERQSGHQRQLTRHDGGCVLRQEKACNGVEPCFHQLL
jgi:hypothetical protein